MGRSYRRPFRPLTAEQVAEIAELERAIADEEFERAEWWPAGVPEPEEQDDWERSVLSYDDDELPF